MLEELKSGVLGFRRLVFAQELQIQDAASLLVDLRGILEQWFIVSGKFELELQN